MIDYKIFNQEPSLNLTDYQAVLQKANSLYEKLSKPGVQRKIREANIPKASSQNIQDVIAPHATDLGFQSEKKGLFADHPTSLTRPDFFLEVGYSGILIEVERGRTIMNNMDYIDFWKCHICSDASYLFLFVPSRLQQNKTRPPTNTFHKVCNRMQPFFEPEHYTNVLALFLYGYY